MIMEVFSSPQASDDDAGQAQRRDPDVEVPPPHFQYLRPLHEREIRLLKIENGEGDSSNEGEINCKLTYHTLDELARNHLNEEGVLYIALSYAWGDFDISHTIKCDGQDLAVSKTLYSAIICLSKKVPIDDPKRKIPEVSVWIDAICINQSDVVEKANQVRMMKTIYGQAVAVLGWLGEEEEADRRSLEFMRKIVRTLEIQDKYQDHTEATVADDEVELQPASGSSPAVVADPEYSAIFADSRLPLDLPDADSSEWDDFLHLIEKPWFSRVWIIQEFVAAKYFEFLCGGTLIEAKQVFEPINMLLRSQTFCAQITTFRSTKRRLTNSHKLRVLKQKMKTKTHQSLLAILAETVNFEAKDPRDKVFAVLGLSNDSNNDLIDYKADLRKVLINTARRLLELENGSLEMLSWAHALARTDDIEIPSWVIQWSSSEFVMIPLAHIFPSSTNNSEDRADVSYSEVDKNNVSLWLWVLESTAAQVLMHVCFIL
jgi:Heterokaryon incompatibility protein (HET)